MTIDKKRDRLNQYCGSVSCDKCVLNISGKWSNPLTAFEACPSFDKSPEHELDIALSLIGEPVPEEVEKDSADPVSEESTEAPDPVNHPSHYTDGKIEVIDYIEDKKLGFCLGNAVKYISRAGKKDPTKEIEDLNKAAWYIERRIKELKEGLA